MPDTQIMPLDENLDRDLATKERLTSLKKFIVAHRQVLIFLTVFFVNILLVSPSLMPDLYAVNPDDEAKYVDSGWRLLHGNIRDLAWAPLVAGVYAPIHLAVGNSPDWFMLEVWVGRFLLYAFLWWCTLYLGLQLKEYVSPYIVLGVLFVATPFLVVPQNQSDVIFTGFSALALAELIQYARKRELRYLGIASFFVGMGVMARVETLLLLGTLSVIGLILGIRKFPVYKILIAALLPALCVFGVYLMLSIVMLGRVNLGLGYKSYDSFEMNQAIFTNGDIEKARQEARRLFGTEAENNGSIFRAIMRNPLAFLQRLPANAKTLPYVYFDFFGKRLGIVLFIFSVLGVYIIFRKRDFLMLFVVLFWFLYLLVPLGFLSLHIVPQFSYFLLLLGAIGIASLFGSDLRLGEQLLFVVVILLIVLASWITNKPAFLMAFLMVFFALCLSWLVRVGWKEEKYSRQFGLFFLLVAGLIIRAPFTFPDYPTLGKTADEQAIHYLLQNLPIQSSILVSSPVQAIAAKLSYTTYDAVPDTIVSVKDLWKWLKQENVIAMYVNSKRRGRNDIYDLMEKGYEEYFTPVFVSEDGSIRIFTVK